MFPLAVEYLNREFLEEIEKIVTDMAQQATAFLTTSLIDRKGLTYGDVELSASERVQKFMDDEMTGVNAALRVSNPDEYQKRLNQFRRDVESTGLVEDLSG